MGINLCYRYFAIILSINYNSQYFGSLLWSPRCRLMLFSQKMHIKCFKNSVRHTTKLNRLLSFLLDYMLLKWLRNKMKYDSPHTPQRLPVTIFLWKTSTIFCPKMEMDTISPTKNLWRYCDQPPLRLRLPSLKTLLIFTRKKPNSST